MSLQGRFHPKLVNSRTWNICYWRRISYKDKSLRRWPNWPNFKYCCWMIMICQALPMRYVPDKRWPIPSPVTVATPWIRCCFSVRIVKMQAKSLVPAVLYAAKMTIPPVMLVSGMQDLTQYGNMATNGIDIVLIWVPILSIFHPKYDERRNEREQEREREREGEGERENGRKRGFVTPSLFPAYLYRYIGTYCIIEKLKSNFASSINGF